MAKDIGQSGISIPKPTKSKDTKKTNTPKSKTKNTKIAESSAFADLNFKVSNEFKWEFKSWAANHQMSQKAVLEAAFEVLKEQYD